MKLKTIFAAAALVACASAHAMDAGTLFDRIRGNDSDRINAYGYVSGATEMLEAMGIVCMPDRTRVSQATAIVESYIQVNPRRRPEYAADVVASALRAAWPCKRGTNGAV